MRLVSFREPNGVKAGVVIDGQVYDVAKLRSDSRDFSVADVIVLANGDFARMEEQFRVAAAGHEGARVGSLSEVQLAPPVPDPCKVLCIGLNYADHVAETGRELPKHPDIFAKFATTLIGPFDVISCRDVTSNLDFEGELAIVIGKAVRNVAEDEALSAIAGLMVLNDTTARDLQYRGTQWLAGKAVDASTPCGPELVTLDEISDPHGLDISTRVNGVTMQNSNTRHLIFRLPTIVSYVSKFLELRPGDIIATGTPEGIGAKRQPPMWLQPGDVVEVEVAEVGKIRNVIA